LLTGEFPLAHDPFSWHSTRRAVEIIDSNKQSHEYIVQQEVIALQAFEDGRLTATQDQALKGAGGVFLFHSIRSRHSFEHILTLFDRTKSKNIPIFVSATKIDLVNERVVSAEEGRCRRRQEKVSVVQ
jgi:GTPase SAR1 family protein